MDRQISPGELRQLVLGVLAHHDSYGIEIAASIAAQLDVAPAGPEFPEGSVYPALRWLERHGLALAHWVEVGEGAPRRRYYSLTPRGRRVAAVEGQRSPKPHPQRPPSASAARP